MVYLKIGHPKNGAKNGLKPDVPVSSQYCGDFLSSSAFRKTTAWLQRRDGHGSSAWTIPGEIPSTRNVNTNNIYICNIYIYKTDISISLSRSISTNLSICVYIYIYIMCVYVQYIIYKYIYIYNTYVYRYICAGKSPSLRCRWRRPHLEPLSFWIWFSDLGLDTLEPEISMFNGYIIYTIYIIYIYDHI